MSAMKMAFITSHESPEKEETPPPAAASNAAKLSALLNSTRDSDVDMESGSSGRNTPEEMSALRASVGLATLAGGETPTNQTDRDMSEKYGMSDNENSEDEQAEHAAWQDVDLNPAVDLVRSFEFGPELQQAAED